MGITKTAIIAADFHLPFQNDEWLKYLLTALKEKTPDKLIIAGDFVDLYSISKFDTAPCRADDLEYELTIAREVLQKFRHISKEMEIIFITGNHENRLIKFLSRGKNKALFNLACLKLENLLNFEKYNVKLIPHIYELNKNWIVIHGSRCGLNAAQAEALSYLKCGFSGHVHKSIPFDRNYLDKRLIWHSLPCMSDINKADYAIDFRHTWNNGFMEIEYDNTDCNIIKLHKDLP